MDIAGITEAVGLASSAVGLTGKAATTAETIKKLFASDKSPDAGEAAQLLNTLASELTAANMTNVQLSEALRSLSQELQRQDDFEREKSRYELFQTECGDTIFKLREDAENGQHPHFICPVCLNRDRLISYLRIGKHSAFCQTDKNHSFAYEPRPTQERVRRHTNSWLG